MEKEKEKEKRITYDDILAKMGMIVENGKLTLIKDTNVTPVINTYTYINEYEEEQGLGYNDNHIPKTKQEYEIYLYNKLLEKKRNKLRVKQIKSKSLLMPVNNINVSSRKTPENIFFRFA